MKRLTVTIMLLLFLTSCGRKETPSSEVAFAPIEIEQQELVLPIEEPEVVAPVEQRESYEFRVTAYCPCEICCGQWALNRPKDENGEVIVRGASGERLNDWYSVASPLPFGTQIELDGIGVVEVQDRTADWVVEEHGQYILDIYMTDHQEAWDFGVQYIRGELIE